MTTHLLMYRWEKCVLFVPITYCGTRYSTMKELQGNWRKVTCRKCRKAGRAHEALRKWWLSPAGQRASDKAFARGRDHDA